MSLKNRIILKEALFCDRAERKEVDKQRDEFYDKLRKSEYVVLKSNGDGTRELTQAVNDMGEITDGYHSFNELYYYRTLYNAAFFNSLAHYDDWTDGSWDVEFDVHKSKKHSAGEECFDGGWFIVMAELPTGQISNYYEMKYWDLFKIPEKEVANVWDGHSPECAAERLKKYLEQS